MGDLNEAFRKKLNDVLDRVRIKIGAFLIDSQADKELSPSLNISEISDFILSSWQGALLQMKVTKSVAPLQVFDRMIFESVLKQ